MLEVFYSIMSLGLALSWAPGCVTAMRLARPHGNPVLIDAIVAVRFALWPVPMGIALVNMIRSKL